MGMEQLKLPMLTVYVGPRLMPAEVVAACRSYRAAVIGCWATRSRRGLTQRRLAEEVGCRPSHLSEWLNVQPDSATARDLPAKHITEFEVACGNRLVSQWLARQANLTIMEQFIERRAA